MFRVGEENLSSAERTRSTGVVAVYYADEGDYRLRFFSELDFFDMPMGKRAEPIPGQVNASYLETVTFGDRWNDGEPVEVTVDHVRDWYVPLLQQAWAGIRAAPDEPPHLAYEVYWRGELILQEEAPQ